MNFGNFMNHRLIKPKKSLGQNFLIDKNIANFILDTADLTKDDTILEIGAGRGILTLPLTQRVKRVIALEIDRRLCEYLEKYLANYKNIEIINADALEFRYEDLEIYKKVKVVANLPYYISTPVLLRLIEARRVLKSITVMLQKEVGERIVAVPGNKNYGSLSIAVQYYCQTELVQAVSRTVFYPRPKVDSTIVKFTILDEPVVKVNDEKVFFKLVRAAFAQRRKTLKNNLKSDKSLNFGEELILKAFQNIGIETNRRGETLSLEEFAKLSNYLAEYIE